MQSEFCNPASTFKHAAGLASAAAALLAHAALAVTPAIVMRQSGPHTNRVDVLYAAEAFLASEMQTFRTAANRAMLYRDTSTLGQPYKRYRNFFNFYSLELKKFRNHGLGAEHAPARSP